MNQSGLAKRRGCFPLICYLRTFVVPWPLADPAAGTSAGIAVRAIPVKLPAPGGGSSSGRSTFGELTQGCRSRTFLGLAAGAAPRDRAARSPAGSSGRTSASGRTRRSATPARGWPCAPGHCSGTSTPMDRACVTISPRALRRSRISMAFSIMPTGCITSCLLPPLEAYACDHKIR